VIETEPDQILEVRYSLSESSNEQIVLEWAKPVDGGAPILGFDIKQSVKDSNVWSTLTVDASLTSYTITDSISGGTTYSFKLASFNKYGSSPDSSILDVTAGQAPEQVQAPQVNTEDQLYVVVTWLAPFANHASI